MNKIVVRFKDGRVLKGTSLDLDPSKPTFHVRPEQGAAVQVELADLKALFFVRSLDGDAAHDESRVPDPSDPRSRGATIIKLGFADGETIVGSTIRYPPNRPFFYVVPVDAKSNNIRILINKDAVTSMEQVSGT